MVKICPKCGSNNSDEAFWCINCNSKLPNKDTNEIYQQRDVERGFVEKKKSNIDNASKSFIDSVSPTQSQNRNSFNYDLGSNIGKKEFKKSRFKIGKIIFVFVVLLISIIILTSTYLLFFTNDEEKFIGEWNYTAGYANNILVNAEEGNIFNFYSNGTFVNFKYSTGATDRGTWELEFFHKIKFDYDDPTAKDSTWSYEFSENNMKLKLTLDNDVLDFYAIYKKT